MTSKTVCATWRLDQNLELDRALRGFFARVKSQGALFGVQCPQCGKVFCPPRSVCEWCYVETGRWRRVGPTGTLQAITVVQHPFKGFPKPPYAIGYVQPDGADTAILNFIQGRDWVQAQDWSQLIGSSCLAVMKRRRSGSWKDFYFSLDGVLATQSGLAPSIAE